MGIITAVAATGLAAGLAITGVSVAAANSPSASSAASSSITLPAGGVLAQRVTGFCERVPNLIVRAGKAQTRISGTADTKGSLAWLKAKEAKAKTDQHPGLARRIERVINKRTRRLAKLPEVKTKLASAQKECGTLNLPTATPSASPSTS